MKKIICKVLEFLFPVVCEASRRRVSSRRSARAHAMDAMLYASSRLREDGKGVDTINYYLDVALLLYRDGSYHQCTNYASRI